MSVDYKVLWILGTAVTSTVKVLHSTERVDVYDRRTGVKEGTESLRVYTCTVEFPYPVSKTFLCRLEQGDRGYSSDNTEVVQERLDQWFADTLSADGYVLGRKEYDYTRDGEWHPLFFIGVHVESTDLHEYNNRILDPQEVAPRTRDWWQAMVSEELHEVSLEVRPLIYIG